MPKTLFVTVGTTRFDALIEQVSNNSFLKTLSLEAGFDTLWIQHGNSPFALPQHTSSTTTLHDTTGNTTCFSFGESTNKTLAVTWFPFTSSLAPFLKHADLVISHAGTGSILETFSFKKPLIVIPNAALMHNHQLELAKQLHCEKVLVCCEEVERIEQVVAEWEKVFEGVDCGKWWSDGDPLCGSRKVMNVVMEEAFK
ncbi:glycosyl transferase [Obelidium mucronatum]|nr:glycosyl transferase [Obelidium mucronatum]